MHRTFRMLRGVRCDVFHCHNVHTSPLIGAALAGVPVRLWSKLAMSPFYELGSTSIGIHGAQLSTRLSAMLSQQILCISTAVRNELAGIGIPEHKLVVAPVPVDLSAYGRAANSGLRTELGLNDSDFIITAVGCAIWIKGWDILVTAFAKLADAVPQARLVLVGKTDNLHGKVATRWSQLQPITQRLQSLVEQFGLRDKVYFLGERGDVPGILNSCDIFAMPSRSEGLGSSLLEACAAGLACVGANVGGIPDAISHGENGLLFEREDAAGLGDALIELARDVHLRERLEHAARESARRYDLAADSERLIKLYTTLLETRGYRVEKADRS